MRRLAGSQERTRSWRVLSGRSNPPMEISSSARWSVSWVSGGAQSASWRWRISQVWPEGLMKNDLFPAGEYFIIANFFRFALVQQRIPRELILIRGIKYCGINNRKLMIRKINIKIFCPSCSSNITVMVDQKLNCKRGRQCLLQLELVQVFD